VRVFAGGAHRALVADFQILTLAPVRRKEAVVQSVARMGQTEHTWYYLCTLAFEKGTKHYHKYNLSTESWRLADTSAGAAAQDHEVRHHLRMPLTPGATAAQVVVHVARRHGCKCTHMCLHPCSNGDVMASCPAECVATRFCTTGVQDARDAAEAPEVPILSEHETGGSQVLITTNELRQPQLVWILPTISPEEGVVRAFASRHAIALSVERKEPCCPAGLAMAAASGALGAGGTARSSSEARPASAPAQDGAEENDEPFECATTLHCCHVTSAR
jgi:hypothetical protein